MLVKQQDIRLKSAGIFMHSGWLSHHPHPTHRNPSSLYHSSALATPYPSEIDPASLCPTLCLDSSTLLTRALGRRPDWLPHYGLDI